MDREEAIEIIRKNMPSDKSLPVYEALRTLVPELAESEDEKMVVKIARTLSFAAAHNLITDYDELIAMQNWLEKQKEQKPDSLIYDKDLDKAAREYYLSGGAASPLDSTGLVPIVRMAEFGATWMKERMEKEQKPAEWSAKGRRGRIGSTPEHIRKKAENFLSKMEPPYDADDICSAYETGAMENANSSWSEEDEKMLRTIISDGSRGVELDSKQISWLKSLRPQSKKELSIEKAIQWLDDTFYFLNNSSGRGRDCEITTHDFDSLEEMYDSFRKAVTVDSEPSWKPSEEHLSALLAIFNDPNNIGSQTCQLALTDLYEQLKRLM